LHIALALNKDLLAIFKSTNPEIVVKSNSNLQINNSDL
jgi:ADP-heptose:LPS heptosyltransferase